MKQSQSIDQTIRQQPLQVAELPSGRPVQYREAKREAAITLLFVHGLTGTHDSLVPMADVWVRRGYHVVTINLPGHGGAEPIDITTINDLVSWLSEVVDYFRADNRLVIVGNSFGCGIITEYVRSHGIDDLTRVVLTAPAPVVNQLLRPLERSLAKLPDSVARQIFYQNRLLEPLRIWMMINNRQNDSYRARASAVIRSTAPYVRHQYCFDTMMRLTIEQPPYRTPLPMSAQLAMSIVYGDHDRVTGRSLGPTLRRFAPLSQLVEIPDCGHQLHVEAVDVVSEVIEQNIQALEQSA